MIFGIDDGNILDHLPGYIGWKNIHFKYEGCNRNLSAILGLKDVNYIIGLSDSCFSCNNEDLIEFHIQNDKLAVNGNTVKALHQSSAPYDGSFFYFVKKPLLNKEQTIIGLIYHCQEFSNNQFLSDLRVIDKKTMPSDRITNYYYLSTNQNPYKLSTRESETLFFLLRGKSAKQIGEVLKLSKRTIESYIEQIKNKFACNTKTELVYLALTNGYQNNLPTKIILNSSKYP